jgi:dolichyl-phosphate-mannose--protein O-mannosyl transferase
VTALAAIVNGIIIATGGKELIKQALENAGLGGLSDADLDMAAQVAGYESMDDVLSAFTTRGYLVAGCGVLLLIFGVLMRRAATFARVMVTISAVLVMVFSLLVLADETTGTMAGLAMLAILGGVLSVVFTWLPANGRYGKAVRAAG